MGAGAWKTETERCSPYSGRGQAHWHGAATDSWFQHLAIEVPGENCNTEWCEAVSEEDKKLETTGFSLAEKKNTIRSLMNIRMPGEVSDELTALQDDYLQEELKSKGVVALSDIPDIKEQFGSNAPFSEKISLWKGDITRLKVGAIVNAANSQLLGCFVPCHRCIDNAIHSAADCMERIIFNVFKDSDEKIYEKVLAYSNI